MSSSDSDVGDAPLPLEELRQWICTEERYAWIQTADEEVAKLKKECEENSYMNASNVFGSQDDSDDEYDGRVQEWVSSIKDPNGYGCTHIHEDDMEGKKKEPGAVYIKCLISDSWHGFGDTIWASARHIANLLADPDKCRNILLTPSLRQYVDDKHLAPHHHPLLGLSFLELGAGAAVPSWTAMKCGARVVCTDQAVANRIRCMAESAERNWRDMVRDHRLKGGKEIEDNPVLINGKKARACPHDWGKNTDEVSLALSKDGKERFDIIVAADCCYIPLLHKELIDSIDMLMSERGVAFIPFACHGNCDDNEVWGIVDRAKEKGFQVDLLEPQQLTPPKKQMGLEQGLVNTVRLTRN